MRAHVLVRDHFGDRQHQRVTARVIVVLMSIDYIAKRLGRRGSYLSQDVVVIPVEHVVHEHDAFGRREHGDVSTFAGN